MDQIDTQAARARAEDDKWQALVALTNGVNAIQAVPDNAPASIHQEMANWLDVLEADYRRAAEAFDEADKAMG